MLGQSRGDPYGCPRPTGEWLGRSLVAEHLPINAALSRHELVLEHKWQIDTLTIDDDGS
jgi:hypothetical protein